MTRRKKVWFLAHVLRWEFKTGFRQAVALKDAELILCFGRLGIIRKSNNDFINSKEDVKEILRLIKEAENAK